MSEAAKAELLSLQDGKLAGGKFPYERGEMAGCVEERRCRGVWRGADVGVCGGAQMSGVCRDADVQYRMD